MMPGRRYSEGLHQALEAKEHVTIQPENQTLASITFQNYFRMYKKLSGMTGTALTEADEFGNIYKLEVVEVPTNLPVSASTRTTRSTGPSRRSTRRSSPRSKEASAEGPAGAGRHHLDRKVGTARRAAAQGYKLHRLHHPGAERPLPRAGSAVLIVAQAGRPGAITIATNMAGRGTDIQLGGNADMRIADELGDMRPAPSATRRKRDPRGRAPEAGQGARRRRPLRHRHRAPRKPPHRQPAARPLRPSGRPRPLEVLPVAAGRPDAHLRLRAHGRHADRSSASRKARRSSIRGSTRRWKRRRRRSRRATSTSARTC
jgi:hypothetical protein